MSKNWFVRVIKERHSIGYIIVDIVAMLAAAVIALSMRFDFDFNEIDPWFWTALLHTVVITVVVSVFIFMGVRLYSILWRYAGLLDVLRLVIAVILSDIFFFVLSAVTKNYLPRSFFILYPDILIIIMGAVRLREQLGRNLKDIFLNASSQEGGVVTLIFGAGQAGQTILHEIKSSKLVTRNVVAVLDDDPKKWGTYIKGIPVVGGRDSLAQCVNDYQVKEIIIAIPTMSNKARKELIEICNQTNCKISILPGIYQLLNKEVSVSALRAVELEDLLGREPIQTNLESIMSYVSNKVVLVTGGGGSIGSELCRQIAQYQPKQLIILDNYENNAYDLQMELMKKHPDLALETIIANVQDRPRVHDIFQTYKPNLIFHAAAHKHVPLMEDSPCEAIKNNVCGTWNVTEEAILAGVDRFVMISTDKAVRPTNIMGASKRICEMIVQTANQVSDTDFVSVRFGNVLGSNGSVVPLFKKQIAAGGPVTVTHPDIIRYFMTIPEAVSLVLQAGAYAKGGEIFILDMGEPVRILDMANNLIRLSGLEPGVDIEVKFTGLRPGEKLYEELLMDEEKTETENNRIFVGQPIPVEESFLLDKLAELKEAAYGGSEKIRAMVQELVPEYTYKVKE